MPQLRMKIGGERYTVDPDKLTLDEACLLEEEYGVADLSDLNFFKPKHLKGLFFTAVKRKHPELTDDEIMGQVRDGVTGDVFADLNKQAQEAMDKLEDPPVAGVVAPSPAKPARGAGTRKTSGARS